MTESRAEARKKIQLLKNLPTLPGMIEQISRAVESKRFSVADIGRLISRDQVLSAKVLKLANSAFFGFSRKVGSLTQALVLLGFDVVKGLILTSSVFDLMKNRAEALWVHSMGVATAASIIATEIEFPEAEEASIAGLLHDLGKVVLRAHMPEDNDAIAALMAERGLSVREAEREVLGFDHSHIGQWLAESWKLPENLIDPIRWHHQPEGARNAPLVTAVVHLADHLTRAYGLGDGGDDWVPELDRAAMKRLNLSGQQLENIVESMCDKLSTVGAGFD
ncbi:MAG: HDOD domain-containing protein [Desulfarculus sp.]|nr:HDOD domain-containing protein [Desulfarculus sp.]